MGAVLIEGMKWCGKTTTAEQKAQSIIYLDEPGKKQQYLYMAALDPQKLLVGKHPRLLDEWQIVPEIWDAVRFSVDHGDQERMYILTGSALTAVGPYAYQRPDGTYVVPITTLKD